MRRILTWCIGIAVTLGAAQSPARSKSDPAHGPVIERAAEIRARLVEADRDADRQAHPRAGRETEGTRTAQWTNWPNWNNWVNWWNY